MEFGNQPAELAAQSSIRVLAGKNGNKSWPKLLQPNEKKVMATRTEHNRICVLI